MKDQAILTETTNSEVGYKRPPVKSRFRKGQSGNPRGRRKGQRNLTTVLREVLAQTVKVKRGGKTERMSKAEALVQMLLSKAHGGDTRAIKALLHLTEKIARINAPEPRRADPGNYEFMLVPGVAASREEYERECNMREAYAEIREIVKLGAAKGKSLNDAQRTALKEMVEAARATGTTVTTSQLDWLREILTPSTARPPIPDRPMTRRAINRRNASAPTPDSFVQPAKEESAAPAQTAAVQPALPNITRADRTPTYRKVNRRPPTPPAID
jgi:Family of unknown function (DUF5681)